MNISEAVKKLANTQPPSDNVLLCIAKNIREQDFICDAEPIDGSADIQDVKFCIDEHTNFVLVPKENTTILVVMDTDVSGFVVMTSEIQKIILSVNDGAKIEIKEETITFNSGDFGGLVKIQPLIDKINRLENQLNSLYSLLKTHVHPVSAVGSPTGNSPNLAGLTNIDLTQKNELENLNITH